MKNCDRKETDGGLILRDTEEDKPKSSPRERDEDPGGDDGSSGG